MHPDPSQLDNEEEKDTTREQHVIVVLWNRSKENIIII